MSCRRTTAPCPLFSCMDPPTSPQSSTMWPGQAPCVLHSCQSHFTLISLIMYLFNEKKNASTTKCFKLCCILGGYALEESTSFDSLMFVSFRIATQNKSGENYYILLILTDGVITDMPQTCEAIVQVLTAL